jgi:hypothetical protein
MDVSARSFCICVVLCAGIGFASGQALPIAYRVKKMKKQPRPKMGCKTTDDEKSQCP